MSMEQTVSVTCPACQAENACTLWSSLNADLDPAAKEQLLDGSLFEFTCEACGHTALLNYEMLYHDMQHRVMVSYCPPEQAEQRMAEFEEIRRQNEAAGVSMQDYRFRIVTSQNALREKVLIFDLGLDDRIVEITKLYTLVQVDRDHPDCDIGDAFFMEHEGRYFFYIDGEENLTTSIPPNMYHMMEQEYGAQLAAQEEEYQIDLDWAGRFLLG